VSPKSENQHQDISWYESNLLWGGGSTCLNLICVVAAVMKHDLRWLLILAWPFGVIAVFALLKGLRLRLWIIFPCAILIGFILLEINILLNPNLEKISPSSIQGQPTKQRSDVLQIAQPAVKNKTAVETAKEPSPPLAKQTVPVPPEMAKLQFTFCPDGKLSGAIIDKITAPPENGVVTVYLSAKNISTVNTDNIVKIWIQICDECKFAEEPQGVEPSQAYDDNVIIRRLSFGYLYAGIFYDPFKLKIIPPFGYNSFTIGLYYACEKCPPVDLKQKQILIVNLKDEFLEHYYNRIK
jgi:hypothetical protein